MLQLEEIIKSPLVLNYFGELHQVNFVKPLTYGREFETSTTQVAPELNSSEEPSPRIRGHQP